MAPATAAATIPGSQEGEELLFAGVWGIPKSSPLPPKWEPGDWKRVPQNQLQQMNLPDRKGA